MYKLSASVIADLNQVLEAAERILQVRGQPTAAGGVFYRKDRLAILAAPPPGCVMRLTIAYDSSPVLDVVWQPRGQGHVAIDVPGPWRDQLLALPVHDA